MLDRKLTQSEDHDLKTHDWISCQSVVTHYSTGPECLTHLTYLDGKINFQIPSSGKYDHLWNHQKSLWISEFEVMAPQKIPYSQNLDFQIPLFWKYDHFYKSLKILWIPEAKKKPSPMIPYLQDSK